MCLHQFVDHGIVSCSFIGLYMDFVIFTDSVSMSFLFAHSPYETMFVDNCMVRCICMILHIGKHDLSLFSSFVATEVCMIC